MLVIKLKNGAGDREEWWPQKVEVFVKGGRGVTPENFENNISR